MGRKFTLQQKSRALLNKQKHGSLATKREHQRVMYTIISDLARLKCLPESFEKLTSEHVEKLVHFWQDKGLSTATIGNKLGILRRFNHAAKLNVEIPNNQTLNNIKPSPTPLKIPIPDRYQEKIYHPITRSLIDLQVHFGLTKLEAIRLNPYATYVDHTLLIHRNIAHNQQDRMIPVITKAQERCLNDREIIAKESHLLKRDNLNALMSQLYRAECQDAGIHPKTPFRKCYAQSRLATLQHTLDEPRALLTLCDEMGFSAPRKLLGLLS